MSAANPTDKIKIWLFPTLMSIVTAIIWNDINEIKNDVKGLLAQSNQDKIRVNSLEKQVDIINQKLFLGQLPDGTKAVINITSVPNKKTPPPASTSTFFLAATTSNERRQHVFSKSKAL